jgi:RNA polymerase sigma-70 factor (sigma-E family)
VAVPPGVRRDQAHEAFDAFVALACDDLLRTAYLLVWDLTAAEDLVQECLFRTARQWPRVRSMDHPKAYARRILVNLALDGAKRRHRHQRELDVRDNLLLEIRGDEAASAAFARVDKTSELKDALRTLAPRQRATLVLRYFEDLSEAQVAELLGCSVGNVKSTTSRALARLRHVLAPISAASNPFLPPDVTDPNGANDERATRI